MIDSQYSQALAICAILDYLDSYTIRLSPSSYPLFIVEIEEEFFDPVIDFRLLKSFNQRFSPDI